MHSDEKVSYQYALLNLAMLQADFGCNEEALHAIEDTINTARESGDTACLNFALAWMFEFKRSQYSNPSPEKNENDDQILEHLARNSQKAQLPILQTTVHLLQVQKFLDDGSSLIGVFSNLTKAFALFCANESFDGFPRYMDLLQSIWYRLGCSILSMTYISIYQKNHVHDSPALDLLQSLITKAWRYAELGRWLDVATILSTAEVQSQRSFQCAHLYGREKTFIYLSKAIDEKNHMDATLYLKNLNGFRHDKMSTFRTQLYALRLDISLGNLSQAIEGIDKLLEEPEKLAIEWVLQLMFLKVDIYMVR